MIEETEIKVYAPVIIPTLCRYVHFRRCIESLSRCTGADQTEVYVGLDYPAKKEHWDGYNKIKEYLDSCGNLGFKNLIVMKWDYNLGPNDNHMALRRLAFERYDRVIASEDDNEYSLAFLDYMNKALDKYEDDPKVSTVCGYSYPRYKGYQKYDSYFTYICSAWGIGLWKAKEDKLKIELNDKQCLYKRLLSWRTFWKCYTTYPYVIEFLMDMLKKNSSWGDVCRAFLNIEHSRFQVRPSFSLVRNWGDDGSGIHCGDVNEGHKQELTSANRWTVGNPAPITFFLTRYYQFTDFFSQNTIIAFAKIAILPYKYYRFRNKYKSIIDK